MGIRIIDIAKKAGVSIGTVDRVLHNRGEVSTETRKKVLEVINEMGYKPNLFAKRLASNKVYRLAALIPNYQFDNPYWARPLEGIKKAADEIGDFNVEVDIHFFDLNQNESFSKVCEDILMSAPDGIVFHPIIRDISLQFAAALDKNRIPYVCIDTNLDPCNKLAYFGQDAKQSGVVAAKILHCSTPAHSGYLILHLISSNQVTHHLQNREEGFKQYFSETCERSSRVCIKTVDLRTDNIESKVSEIIKNEPEVKGVFVTNSKVFKVAQLIHTAAGPNIRIVGYDLIKENMQLMENGKIDYLISQKPLEQGYSGVMALFNYLVLGKNIETVNLSPIDIIIKENLKYYK